jgi:hypothetical protein
VLDGGGGRSASQAITVIGSAPAAITVKSWAPRAGAEAGGGLWPGLTRFPAGLGLVGATHVTRAADLLLGIPALPRQRPPRARAGRRGPGRSGGAQGPRAPRGTREGDREGGDPQAPAPAPSAAPRDRTAVHVGGLHKAATRTEDSETCRQTDRTQAYWSCISSSWKLFMKDQSLCSGKDGPSQTSPLSPSSPPWPQPLGLSSPDVQGLQEAVYLRCVCFAPREEDMVVIPSLQMRKLRVRMG